MGLFSKLGKTKQSDPDDSATFVRAEEAASAGGSRNRRKSPSSDRKPRGDAVDPMLPEKKRARRRLIGSAALVLALIIALPMVLDTEPKPLSTDIAIQIPARDAPESRQPLRRPAAGSSLGLPGELDPTEEIIELPSTPSRAPLHASASPAQQAGAKQRPEQPAVQPAKPSIDRVSLKPIAQPEPALGRDKASPAESAAAKTDNADDARADRKRETARAVADKKVEKTEKQEKAEKNDKQQKQDALERADRIVLQVAALGSLDKAAELQTRLTAAGVRSFTQKVSTGSGERIRVRVGPYSSQVEADKARAKLAALGLNGTVVSN